MISHIKRSIPDLRSIKHQPLENKESPCGSPKHIVDDNVGVNIVASGVASTSGIKAPSTRMASLIPLEGSVYERDTDTVTLQTTCTCAPKTCVSDVQQNEKNIIVTDDLEEQMAHSSSGHHYHHHYHPYQHQHQHQSQSNVEQR